MDKCRVGECTLNDGGIVHRSIRTYPQFGLERNDVDSAHKSDLPLILCRGEGERVEAAHQTKIGEAGGTIKKRQ